MADVKTTWDSMISALHTCHPYLSPAQLTKQGSLDVKTDWEGRNKDRNLDRVKKSCFFISSFFFFSILNYLLNQLLGAPKIKHLLNHKKLVRKHSALLNTRTTIWQIGSYWSPPPQVKTMDLHRASLRDTALTGAISLSLLTEALLQHIPFSMLLLSRGTQTFSPQHRYKPDRPSRGELNIICPWRRPLTHFTSLAPPQYFLFYPFIVHLCLYGSSHWATVVKQWILECPFPLEHLCQTWLIDHSTSSCWVRILLKTVRQAASSNQLALIQP